MPHDEQNPVPLPPSSIVSSSSFEYEEGAVECIIAFGDISEDEYILPDDEKVPLLVSHAESNDLVGDLCLSIEKSEVLVSRLKE